MNKLLSILVKGRRYTGSSQLMASTEDDNMMLLKLEIRIRESSEYIFEVGF